MATENANPLLLAINGERVELADPDPSMTLLTYIRAFTHFRGTKLGCGEGGCGACIVLVAKYQLESKRVEERTVNSCLVLLCSLHLCAVITTEGLGTSTNGFHAIQRRIAGFHATQCGFCTPGVAMALYGCLRRHSGEGVTPAVAERAVQGNICRCTGYRPILDACKSFAEEADIEDLGLNAFWDRKENASRELLPAYRETEEHLFPEFLVEEKRREWVGSRFLDGGAVERLWIPVRSLTQLLRELRKWQGREVKLVVGNTSAGIFKDVRPEVFIHISGVPELLILRYGDGELEVGAGVSLSKFIIALQEGDGRSVVYAALAKHLEKVASEHVRNVGSVGGNLILAQQLGFDSDLATILLGAGASVKIVSSGDDGGGGVVSIEEFLEMGALQQGSVLVSVIVPSWAATSGANGVVAAPKVVFKTYRASPRPLGNSVAYVNAGFLAQFCRQPDGKRVIRQVRLAFGAFGSKHAVRASEVETVLTGRAVSAELLLEAIAVLKASVVPAPGTHKAAYRSSLLVGHFFDFFKSYLEKPVDTLRLGNDIRGHVCNGSSGKVATTSGKQKIAVWDEFFPVGKPTTKVAAELQASGEAVYVDDIPSPPGCLHAAFVMSDKALAEVKKIDATAALASPGSVALVTHEDIPKPGRNVGVILYGVEEQLFATERVEFYGHPLGLIVADTAQHASEAAKRVKVTYDIQKVGSPILSIEDAVANHSYFDIPTSVSPLTAPVGDFQEAFSQAELKIENAEVSCGHQYQFYMETHAVLVVPDEGGQLVVYSSCQSTEDVQLVVATCLGILCHDVRVITRRIGGGFGGKLTKSCLVAAACAVAAWKLKRPVRMCLDRRTDMLIVGGRNPMKVLYNVGFRKDGKILALQTKCFVNAGYQPDWSVYLPIYIHASTKKYDWGAFAAEYKVVRTNTSSKTSMRGPGDVQATLIAETVIHHVAARLGMSAHDVREKNSHTVETASKFHGPVAAGGAEGFTLPVIWEKLKLSSNFANRTVEVRLFNEKSKWVKRGLAMVPVVFSVTVLQTVGRVTVFADGSVVVEVGGIEMGQGLWTKVEQAAAYGLSQLWDQPRAETVDPSLIRVVQADSLSLGNSGLTGGSTTSEGNALAVLEACKTLVGRLKPIREKLEDAKGTASWEAVVAMARMAGIDLSVQTSSSVDETATYVTVGAAVSEVEIDVLTGETVVLRSDVLYDCGKSLNPAIDIGQVEGAFVQGIGFFLKEEIQVDAEGCQITEGTWLYKPPTMDNIPRIFNVELLNSAPHRSRVLSSKASGEPPLLLAVSTHCAVREAIASARQDLYGESVYFRLDSSASIDQVKTHCGLDNVEQYLTSLISAESVVAHKLRC